MPRKPKNAPHSSSPYKKPDYHSQNKLLNDDSSGMKNGEPVVQKKIKLRTSLDVYNRLMHDFTLGMDLEHVIIGYLDKYLKLIGKSDTDIVEVCILEWTMIDKGGDIPMHHITYFDYKIGNMVICRIWDRYKRLDRLFGSGNTANMDRMIAILSTKRLQKRIQRAIAMHDNNNNANANANANTNTNTTAVHFSHNTNKAQTQIASADTDSNSIDAVMNSIESANTVYTTNGQILIIGNAICVDLLDVNHLPGNRADKHMTIVWRASPKFTDAEVQIFENYKTKWLAHRRNTNTNNLINNNNSDDGSDATGVAESVTVSMPVFSFTLAKWYSNSMTICGELFDFCNDIRRDVNANDVYAINAEQRIPHVSLFKNQKKQSNRRTQTH